MFRRAQRQAQRTYRCNEQAKGTVVPFDKVSQQGFHHEPAGCLEPCNVLTIDILEMLRNFAKAATAAQFRGLATAAVTG
jgi:hypothetical protein